MGDVEARCTRLSERLPAGFVWVTKVLATHGWRSGCPEHSDLVKKGWAGCALSASQASGRLWLPEGVPFL